MSLHPEWKDRVETWRRELRQHLYHRLGTLEFSGFTTFEHLTPEQARKGAFRPMPAETKWGAKWEYAWFKANLELPAEAAGQRIVVKTDTGGEQIIWVNGAITGARKPYFFYDIELTPNAKQGQRFELLVEAYAYHGHTPCAVGPVPPGRESVPEPPAQQRKIGECSFGVWDEEAYQLFMDVETLASLREALDPESLRLAEIDQGLRDFTLLTDFELPLAERQQTFRAARARLKPLLECVNGSTMPLFFCFGHAHIDVAWLWPLAESDCKAARTFSNQLALMEQYPDYKFLQSQPHLYRRLKQLYPELYARVKAQVQAGRWIADGGMWVEADTNISGGEALIRQFLHGKRFFREEFGIENEALWLPDVFGYSGALPQIMRGCGVKYFSTAKIYWTYHGGDPFPHTTFTWEGIDGSEVLVHLCHNYNGGCSPREMIGRWKERPQKDGIATRLYPFGHGDGGGGPTRNHLEHLRRARDLEGVPRTRNASLLEFFKDLEARGPLDRRYVGELYFQAHRGTYTSQARVKRGNRRCELALREAEFWGAVVAALKGPLGAYRFPVAALDEAWKTVLLNQFHDILPGSSIQRVYEEAEAAHQQVLGVAEEATRAAAAALVSRAQAVTVFNSLNWERKALVELPALATGAYDAEGRALPVQLRQGRAWVEATTPACGWTTLRLEGVAETVRLARPTQGLRVEPRALENELMRFEFDARGEIVRILDKEAGRELAAGPCNSFRMYKDVPTQFDAWDIDSMYSRSPVALDEPVQLEVAEEGPLVAALRLTRRLHGSSLTQDIRLRRGSRRLDFHTVVDWQESHKLLKANFPVQVFAQEAVHEIQFGHIRRPNHYSRPFDADRFEVCQHKWTALCEENRGCALLNDSKYGVNVLGNTLALTLLKSGLAPDMRADKGRQEFTYSFYAWNGAFGACDVVRQGYDLNVPVQVASGAAGEGWAFRVDAPNIVLEAVKPAEDGSGDVVLRLYESKRCATRCVLQTALRAKAAALSDMLEQEQRPLALADGRVHLDFRPFEIKTVVLKMGTDVAAQ